MPRASTCHCGGCKTCQYRTWRAQKRAEHRERLGLPPIKTRQHQGVVEMGRNGGESRQSQRRFEDWARDRIAELRDGFKHVKAASY